MPEANKYFRGAQQDSPIHPPKRQKQKAACSHGTTGYGITHYKYILHQSTRRRRHEGDAGCRPRQ
eukprot:scaffold100469_cov32-Tisochrysis_lutea.AAC.5